MGRNTTTPEVQAYIRAAGHPVTPKELRRRFRVGVWGMRYHLQKMHNAGAIKMADGRHGMHTAWVIDNPDVDMTDRRGLHVNSLRNLTKVMENRCPGRPRSAERNKSWAGATELEKCWMSSSVSMDAAARTADTYIKPAHPRALAVGVPENQKEPA